jgi:hypothetical protein
VDGRTRVDFVSGPAVADDDAVLDVGERHGHVAVGRHDERRHPVAGGHLVDDEPAHAGVDQRAAFAQVVRA